SKHTGRNYADLSTHNLEKAQLVLVAQGAAIETAAAVADHLRNKEKIAVGVLGFHGARPFPGAGAIEHLRGKSAVAVLERVDSPLAGDPPLMRELRASLDRAGENARFGSGTHPDYPSVPAAEHPRLVSTIYGLGGAPLRAADLALLISELKQPGRQRLYLGMDFLHASTRYPKQQVLFDSLRRSYPELARLGLRNPDPSPDVRPPGSLTVAVHRTSGQGCEQLAVEAGSFLQQLAGGQLRGKPELAWGGWGTCCIDRFTHAPSALQDPGDEMPVDMAVVCNNRPHSTMQPQTNLCDGGILFVNNAQGDNEVWQSLPSELRETIKRRKILLYRTSLPVPEEAANLPEGEGWETTAVLEPAGYPTPGIGHETLLGGLFGILLDTHKVEVKERKVFTTREDNLRNVCATERTELLNAFRRGFEAIHQINYSALEAPTATPDRQPPREAPMAVRHLGRTDNEYDSLPRFWDQVGMPYRDGAPDAITADPYLATGTIPPLTSTFRNLSEFREILPAFDPQLCTGCGNCWTACPDSAIGATAIQPGALIDTGIRLGGGDALRQASSKLAARVCNLGRKGTTTATTGGELLQEAYGWLQEKMPLPDDRKEAMHAAFNQVTDKIGAVPVAFTDPYFHEPEKNQKRDSGLLLTLAVNPDACKGCGLCVAVCEPESLKSVPQDPARLGQAEDLWQLWEQLPDTPSDIIARAGSHPDTGPMEALLLSRHFLFALAGGDGAEPGSGEKLAIRLALAATEYHQWPITHHYLDDIGEVRRQLTRLIRETLADALPTEDLDRLSRGLDRSEGPNVDLAALTSTSDTALASDGVNAARLRRMIDLAQGLGDLDWRLKQGIHGLGRSRFGLAIAPGSVANWAGEFPYNPFSVPTAIDLSGDTPQLAAGLLEGQLREMTDGLLLLRKARLEIEQPTGAERERSALDRLSWRDLTAVERQTCSPLLLIGSDEVLGGQGFSQIAWLLNSDLPIKIVVTADLDFGLDARGITDAPLTGRKDSRSNLALMALAQRGAYVAQGSISNTRHLLQSVGEALSFNGPALVVIHAPKPAIHGFPVDRTLEQSRLAVNSRAFPLFRYNPNGEGVFGSRIDLRGNPAPRTPWDISGEEQPLTPADWAFAEERFAPRFTPIVDDDPAPTALAAYLELVGPQRKGKTPFISVPGGGNDPVRYKVDGELVEMVERQGHAWRTLQELAGLDTPFTARVKEEIEAQVAKKHQDELAALKQEYEERIRNLHRDTQAEIAGKVKGQLLSLVGFK
ncbi:MAG: pyruvate ferredoxin oxidoreductase, partial [Gammaproteobacteria bacterium]|nr:pyruvate ferredoxin oxidoreductase [Gammaproteobacteria bacterium]